MDELAKTEARNYLSAAGFFVIAAFALLNAVCETRPGETIQLVTGLGLLLIGTLLIVLRKRDMIAILFMMFSIYHLSNAFLPGFAGFPILFCFSGLVLLTLLVTLTGKDKAKWLLVLPPLVILVGSLIGLLSGTNPDIIFWILFAIGIYFALACASERISLPGRKLLTADEETDFKASGSVLGYLLFASATAAFALFYAFGDPSVISLETVTTVKLICCILMVYVSVLLFAVGKMRFTPVMFLLIALTLIFSVYAQGLMIVGVGILLIVIGLFAILRKESRILPGIMLIPLGGAAFISAISGGLLPSVPWLSVILNGLPCLIAVYLAFVVYSQKKLPKF